MIKTMRADAAGGDSDLEAGSTRAGIIALQALTCLIKEATLMIH